MTLTSPDVILQHTHTHTPPTLCLVAISFPCSLVIFLKCIRSTLLATRIMGNDSLEKKGTARELSLVKAPLVKAGCPRIRPDTAHSTSLWPEADFRVFPSTSAGMEEGPAGCWLPWFEASYLLQGGWELSWEPCGFTLSGPVAGFPGPLPLISQSP